MRAGGLAVTALSPAERAREVGWPRAVGGGDGGGGSVARLGATQDAYAVSACPADCEGVPCSGVRLLWEEATLNTTVEVLVDDVVVAPVPGLPPEDLPGTNGVHVRGLPAGKHAFRIRSLDDGTTSEASLEVLEDQPFEDAWGLTFTAGTADGLGACDLVAAFDNPGPPPAFYAVIIDGQFRTLLSGAAKTVKIPRLPAGPHCVGLIGMNGLNLEYRGCLEEACGMLDCIPCNAPSGLLICQVAFEPGNENAVLARWRPGDAYSGGVRLLVDGQEILEPVPVGVSEAVVGGLEPGEHMVGIRGDCAVEGLSNVVESAILILPVTPHVAPVEGAVSCEYSGADGGTTMATWTNADVSTSIDVYVLDGETRFFVATLPGDATLATVTGTTPSQPIVLQFFAETEGYCYGSELTACELPPSAGFIPGICNGSVLLDISSPIFLLNFLFTGGAPPPCRPACDCNGDGVNDISDVICGLGFLFQGLPAPAGYPGCAPAMDTGRCEVSNCQPGT